MHSQPQMKLPSGPVILTLFALLFVPGLYVVLCLSVLVMVAVGGGICFAALGAFGEAHSPFLLVVGIASGVGTGLGLFSLLAGIVKSLKRYHPFEPGIIVPMEREPELRALIREICVRIGTKPPDHVLLHSEPTFAVGSGEVFTFSGKANGRVLWLGAPLLGGLTVNQLRAAIAHEMAHFRAGDTLYSTMVAPVYKQSIFVIEELERTIAQAKSFWERAPLFLGILLPRIYLIVFHAVNTEVMRGQEYRSDAVSAIVCGTDSFRHTLTRVAGISGAWSQVANVDIPESIRSRKPIHNYYGAFRLALPMMAEMSTAHVGVAAERRQGTFDTHPSMVNRFRNVPRVPERFDNQEIAAGLLVGLEAYEEELTKHVMHLVEARMRISSLNR